MKQSDYPRRYDAAVAELNNAGVMGWNAMPPYVRMGRKMGFEPRPTFYRSFAYVAVSSGLYFAVSWGLLMALLVWDRNMSAAMQVVTAAATGLLFGVGMAVWCRHVRRKSRLTSWDDL